MYLHERTSYASFLNSEGMKVGRKVGRKEVRK